MSRIFSGIISSVLGLFFYFIAGSFRLPYRVSIAAFGIFISFSGFIFASFYVFQNFLEGGYLTQSQTYQDKNIILVKSKDQTEVKTAEKENDSNISTYPLYIEITERMEDRLTEEIKAQGRKANTNLFMGVVTAFISVCILGWLSYQATINFELLKLNAKDSSITSSKNQDIYILWRIIYIE
ncbi:hypothetical protein [Acetobacter aceti]|uniref:Uncharacterized protein n=1 Tax=Acetobacter aceti TaxID=435 RepID=A0A6S6PJL4_ACEAC|nr:hypothetical protein [Acetobacter aceti]BCI67519.1 hypothetical protein AAJCM20276_21430 [Acetobacter aceti]